MNLKFLVFIKYAYTVQSINIATVDQINTAICDLLQLSQKVLMRFFKLKNKNGILSGFYQDICVPDPFEE